MDKYKLLCGQEGQDTIVGDARVGDTKMARNNCSREGLQWGKQFPFLPPSLLLFFLPSLSPFSSLPSSFFVSKYLVDVTS